MKRFYRGTLIFLMCGLFYFISISPAQAEEVGFIKRLWRKAIQRIQKKEPPAVSKSKPLEKPKPIKAAPMPPAKPAAVAAPKAESMTKPSKEDMVDVINNDLDIYGSEITVKIPELVEEKGEKGEAVYKYKTEKGDIIDLGKLDEEKLFGLYKRVINEAVFLRTERLNEQLAQTRNVQTQRVYMPPRPPDAVIHRPPSAPPRPPAPPPQPPHQRR